ncbi:MAG: glycosyltransferase family 4 protein [Acidobacteriaceae bacterium]
MKILYVSQYFPPEMGAPSARVSELSRAWAAAGHDVTVLTGFPNHPTGIVPEAYRSKLWRLTMTERSEQVRVVRTWVWPLPNRKIWERLLNYSSFCVSAIVRGLSLDEPDCVIGTSPQLLAGVAACVIARARRAPFIFEVRDLWPESLFAVGVSGRQSLLFRLVGIVAHALYRAADHIVVVSPAFADRLEGDWHVPHDKISIVVNGVRTDLFNPRVDGTALRAKLHLDGKFVVSFIGTIGNAHGVNVLVETARRMFQSHPDVLFLVMGEGAEKLSLQALVKDSGLSNIVILGAQPHARIPEFIRASDVCLVLLRKAEIFKTVIPTKMLEFMACGRPVLLGVEGVAKSIVESAVAGLCVAPEDPGALADAVMTLFHDENLRTRLGENGHRFIAMHMSRTQTATDYIETLAKVIG